MKRKIWIPVLDFGRAGGHRVLAELATQWVRAGHEVTFVANARSAAPYFPTEGSVLWIDDSGARLPGTAALQPHHGPRRVWRVLRSLHRALELRIQHGDVVLANHSLTAWPVACVRRACCKVYYVQAYEPEYFGLRDPSRWPLWLLATASYALPLRRIVNAPIYLRYKALRADTWVPPGLDFAKFHARGRRAQVSSPTVMGCIGRREPEKGTACVLEAQRELDRRGVTVELKVAFGNLPAGVDMPPRTRVVVPTSDAELADFYRSLDFVIAPGSLQLGAAHYPVLEGMACGAGVVTTGYLPATPDCAWIVGIASPSEIADAVEGAIARPAEYERRVTNAVAAVAGFDWESVATRLLHAF